MKCPLDKEIAFLFVSHPTSRLEWRWQARLRFPAGADETSVLPIELTDGFGRPIEAAVFEFAGQRLKVKDGRAKIAAADFLRGKSETALWLHRKGIYPIPGGLTFG